MNEPATYKFPSASVVIAVNAIEPYRAKANFSFPATSYLATYAPIPNEPIVVPAKSKSCVCVPDTYKLPSASIAAGDAGLASVAPTAEIDEFQTFVFKISPLITSTVSSFTNS